jgi:hypothetical protein
MSQTETLLLFILGFAVALFVVLLFGRGLWALMVSWSGWREARKVPAAIRELQAERDGLKAEKAMMAQKLEASLNDMKMRMAEQMAEVSRNRNRLLDLGQSLKERDESVVHLRRQGDDKVAQLGSLQSQVEENVKAINLAYAKVAQKDDELGKMQTVLKEAQATLMMRDEKIRNLIDETKALRELVGERVSAPIAKPERGFTPALVATSSSAQTGNAFDQRFAASSGNPLIAGPEGSTIATDAISDTNDSDELDRGVSNVLSLAERVRGLQTGMKKP